MQELKPPPACSLACQVSHLIVPLFGPFGTPQVGYLITCGRPPVAYGLHTEAVESLNPRTYKLGFGKAHVGDLVTPRRPLVAHDLHIKAVQNLGSR